jgi:hypothetical protein
MKRVIALPHKILDYSCPINGVEDQYEWKTGTRLPRYFLMDLSAIGFIYIKQKRAPAPRMVGWGNGMGKAQHEFLADLIGYHWRCSEGRPFEAAWQMAKASIGQGTPVILGLLDMYHLPYYPKFYHRIHIPQHFVLLVGYDEDQDTALVQDNGLPEIQEISLSDLRSAWNVHNPGQGQKNTLYILEFGPKIASLEEIARQGVKKRADSFLNSPAGFMGLRGMRKAAQELSLWNAEMSEPQWTEALRFLATFTCSVVPNLPQRLLSFPLGYNDPHQACRDRFAQELLHFSRLYAQPQWERSADLFRTSGTLIEQLTQAATEALLGNKSAFDVAPDLMSRIANTEEQAFRLLL